MLAPVDSGEKSSTLTTKELQNYVQTGSNAAEFIKIMPGFGISNGTSNKANYGGETIGINGNGDAGSQSPLNNAYLLQRSCPATRWTSRRTARTSPTPAATAIRR